MLTPHNSLKADFLPPLGGREPLFENYYVYVILSKKKKKVVATMKFNGNRLNISAVKKENKNHDYRLETSGV